MFRLHIYNNTLNKFEYFRMQSQGDTTDADPRGGADYGTARTKIENPRPFRAAVRDTDPCRCMLDLIKQTISDDSDVYFSIIEY